MWTEQKATDKSYTQLWALCKWDTTLILQLIAAISFGFGWTDNAKQKNKQ
jgi:hypothetical protein